MPTVVENVPGAGGNLGIDRVAKGPADGTQICIIPPGLATNQFLYARLAYDPEKDIVPLAPGGEVCRTCYACARTCPSIPWPS